MYQHVFLPVRFDVVSRLEVDSVAATPAELNRLTLGGHSDHGQELVENEFGHAGPQQAVVAEWLERHRGQRIAGVDRQADTVQLVQCRLAPPRSAGVLEVIVDEERVVHHLERHCGTEPFARGPAVGLAGGEQERRPDPLAVPARVLAHQVVEVARGLSVDEERVHGSARQLRVVGERGLDVLEAARHDATTKRTVRLVPGRPVARTCPT